MQLATWTSVIRDINLHKIRAEADSRFLILVVGDDAHTGPIVAVLGRRDGAPPDRSYVRALALPLRDGLEVDLPAVAFVVSTEADLDVERKETLRRLKAAGVHTVTLLVGDRVLWPESAWQLRTHEDARAAVRPHPDDSAIQAGLAPALDALDKDGKLSLLAMARRLPVLRAPYARLLAEDVARANAGFALSTGFMGLVPGLSLPLTAADIVVLTKNQMVMAYRLALAGGKTGSARVVLGEVVGVVGSGLLFRQIARELVGLVPGVGIVPKVAVAYAGTHLVAKVVTAWALEGRTVEIDELRALYEVVISRGRSVALELNARARTGTPDRRSRLSVGAVTAGLRRLFGRTKAVSKSVVPPGRDAGSRPTEEARR